jgi:hypothetical protein
MTAAIFFAKTKMGWTERVVNKHAKKGRQSVPGRRCAAAADRGARPGGGAENNISLRPD